MDKGSHALKSTLEGGEVVKVPRGRRSRGPLGWKVWIEHDASDQFPWSHGVIHTGCTLSNLLFCIRGSTNQARGRGLSKPVDTLHV